MANAAQTIVTAAAVAVVCSTGTELRATSSPEVRAIVVGDAVDVDPTVAEDVPALGCEFEPGVWPEIRAREPVAALLPTLVTRLRDYFPEATLVARLHVDPEAPRTSDPDVFVVVRAALAVDEMLARLDRFDEEWWIENRELAGGRLEVTVESA